MRDIKGNTRSLDTGSYHPSNETLSHPLDSPQQEETNEEKARIVPTRSGVYCLGGLGLRV